MAVHAWMVLSTLLYMQSALGEAASRPHIVTILADDLGWNDVSFHGSNQIPTPNIDALAYNGVILNRHYTLPTCTPSRTAYLTGRYPIRTGMQGFPIRASEPRGLPLTEVTLPQRLKQLGYKTHIVGKWHQGSYRTEYTPMRRGFDSFLGYWHGFIGYYAHTNKETGNNGLDFHRDLCPTRDYEGQYATDVFTQEAVDVIRRHDKKLPLYLLLAHLAVHAGNVDKPLEVPDIEEAHWRFNYIDTPQRRLYAAMLSKLDESVGLVVKALFDHGIINNTIIIFMSDNGAQHQGLFANWGSNWPLRGLKFTLHEGGVRNVAAIWSASFQQPGRVSNQLFHLTDWLPTLYSAAGGNVTDLGDLDGVDQWASLVNNQSAIAPPRTELLVNIDDVAGIEALISGKWKITRGSYKDGIYGSYYGSGRSGNNPHYNITDILNSHVNVALQSVNLLNKSVDSDLILDLRSAAEVNCDVVESMGPLHCSEYCLHDIINDPCEKVSLSADHVDVVNELSLVLNSYREHAISEINKEVDENANPDLHNDTWISWRDSPGYDPSQCQSKKDVCSIVGFMSHCKPNIFWTTLFN